MSKTTGKGGEMFVLHRVFSEEPLGVQREGVDAVVLKSLLPNSSKIPVGLGHTSINLQPLFHFFSCLISVSVDG
jgi:hypothetical protein